MTDGLGWYRFGFGCNSCVKILLTELELRARNIKRQQPLMTSKLRDVGDVQYVFSRPGRRALKGLLDRKTNLSCHPRSANTAQEDT